MVTSAAANAPAAASAAFAAAAAAPAPAAAAFAAATAALAAADCGYAAKRLCQNISYHPALERTPRPYSNGVQGPARPARRPLCPCSQRLLWPVSAAN